MYTTVTVGTKRIVRAKQSDRKGKIGAFTMKGAAAGVHLPTHWLFEPENCPNNIADHCLHCSFLH